MSFQIKKSAHSKIKKNIFMRKDILDFKLIPIYFNFFTVAEHSIVRKHIVIVSHHIFIIYVFCFCLFFSYKYYLLLLQRK